MFWSQPRRNFRTLLIRTDSLILTFCSMGNPWCDQKGGLMIYLTLKARNSLVLFKRYASILNCFCGYLGFSLVQLLIYFLFFFFFFFGGGGDYIGLLINHLIICWVLDVCRMSAGKLNASNTESLIESLTVGISFKNASFFLSFKFFIVAFLWRRFVLLVVDNP